MALVVVVSDPSSAAIRVSAAMRSAVVGSASISTLFVNISSCVVFFFLCGSSFERRASWAG